MGKKRYTPEQIVHLLREADVLLSHGGAVLAMCREPGVGEQTSYTGRRSRPELTPLSRTLQKRPLSSFSSDPVDLPLDLPDRLVTPGISPRPNDHPQVVVEPPEPGLRDLLCLKVGPRGAGEPGFRVDQRPEFAVD